MVLVLWLQVAGVLRITEGSAVVLSPDFARHSDARNGPLTPGVVGTVVTDRGDRFLVRTDSREFWYDVQALQPAPGQSAGGVGEVCAS